MYVVFNPRYCLPLPFPVFLHINKVPSSILLNEVPSPILMWISCILIRYRFTNKRRSSAMKTINLPGLAR